MTSNGSHPEPRPDEQPEPDLGEQAAFPGPRAAYAVNWRMVLAVDAAMGAIVVVAGLIALIVWNFFLGAFLMLVGCLYVAMVVRRGERWRRLRRDAGL
jgi:hypothetical protein